MVLFHFQCDRLNMTEEATRRSFCGFPGCESEIKQEGPLSRSEWDRSLGRVDGSVKEYPSHVWNTMSEDEQRSTFQHHNIVIRDSGGGLESRLTGWDDRRLRCAVNFDALRQAHGSSSDHTSIFFGYNVPCQISHPHCARVKSLMQEFVKRR